MTDPNPSSLLEHAGDRAHVAPPPIERMVAGATRRRRRTATLLAGSCAAVVAVLVGVTTVVSPGSSPSTPTPATSPTPSDSATSRVDFPETPANEHLAVGETAELLLFLHCGLQYVNIDGTAWETNPRGNGSAPDGWAELLVGTATRTTEDTVVFSSPGVVDHLVFHPTSVPTDYVCY